ncbi:dolichol-phosphate mannosyltransferase subunit 3-like [Amphiura filiformis]|uniref:dolichol-phosphate mannosyltransferase subunit 3-like n=1 Tax=Amphiura filiformis TaxID=82378 RepID=UPI003B2174DC
MATKLAQWLTALTIFSITWATVTFQWVPVPLDSAVKDVILLSPIYLLIVFACYSLATIGYRVYTFNDCEGAAEELKQEIEEARKDLKKRGFKFS